MKTKVILAVLAFFLFKATTAFSQEQDGMHIKWQNSLGTTNNDTGFTIIQIPDGSMIVAGVQNTKSFVARLDYDGNIVWYDSTSLSENYSIYAGAYLGNNEFILAGKYSNDAFACKMNISGSVIWNKTYPRNNPDWIEDIAIDTGSGDIFMVGSCTNDSTIYINGIPTTTISHLDVYLIKADPANGDTIFTKYYGTANAYETGHSIVVDNSNTYITGNKIQISQSANSDIIVLKTNMTGDLITSKTISGAEEEIGWDIQSKDTTLIVCGYTASTSINNESTNNHGGYDGYVLVMNKNLDIISQKCFGGSNDDIFYSLKIDDNRYIFGGSTASYSSSGDKDYWIFITDNNLDSLESSNFGSSADDESYDLIAGTSQFVLTGISGAGDQDVTSSLGNNDCWTIALTSGIKILDYTHDFYMCAFDDTTLVIDATSIHPISYEWWHNGNIVASTSSIQLNSVSYADSGLYTCYLYNDLDTDTINIHVGIYSLPQVYMESSTLNICYGDSVEITAHATSENMPVSFMWITGETDSSIIYYTSNEYETVYVTVTDNFGCQQTDSTTIHTVIVDSIPICLVTVDTATNKCLIVWERPVANTIVSFNVYREISSNNYQVIGTVPWDSMTIFLDTAADPTVTQYSYKISAVDTCGNESILSANHKTLHLQASQGSSSNTIDLHWEPYEINGSVYYPPQYYIFRMNPLTEPQFHVIDSVPGTNVSYTDNNAPVGDNYYFIGFAHSACYPSSTAKAVGGPYDYSLSNIDDYSIQTLAGYQKVFVPVSIYPNPMNESTTIRFYNPGHQKTNIKIIAITGKTILERTDITNDKINVTRKNLKSGIYQVIISCGENVYSAKLIVK